MDFLSRTKKVLMEAAGIAPSISKDSRLEVVRRKLDKMELLATQMRTHFRDYAGSARALSLNGTRLCSELREFYKPTPNRDAALDQFSDTNMSIDSVVGEVFGSQFQSLTGIDGMFEAWMEEIEASRRGLEGVEEARKDAFILQAYLKQLQTNSRPILGNKPKVSMMNDLRQNAPQNKQQSVQIMIEQCREEYKTVAAHFKTQRALLEARLQKLVQSRFDMMDQCWFKLMEYQISFFSSGSAFTTSLQKHVDDYAVRVENQPNHVSPQTSPKRDNVPTNESALPQSNAGSEAPQSSPPSAPQSDLEEEEDEALSDTSSDTSSASRKETKKGDSGKKNKKRVERQSTDLFGGLLSGDTYSDGPSSNDIHDSHLQDIFSKGGSSVQNSGASIMDNFSSLDASTDDVLDVPGGQPNDPMTAVFGQPSRASVRRKKEDSYPFDPFHTPPVSSRNTPRNTSSDQLHSTMFDPLSPHHVSSPHSEPTHPHSPARESGRGVNGNKTRSGGSSRPHSRGGGVDSIMDGFGDLSPSGAAGQSESVERLVRARQAQATSKLKEQRALEETMRDEKYEAEAELGDRLDVWEYRNGVRRGIRSLLSSMHTVLWDEAKSSWKPVSLSQLMAPSDVKKHYRKGILKVHPDRAQGMPGNVHFISERCFQALNTAWADFQKQ
eukprot:240588_1